MHYEHIAVFAASSQTIGRAYFEAAEALGRAVGQTGASLVFGAGDSGLMGACARGAHGAGGRVIGVIPKRLNEPGVAYAACDECIITPDMRTRMAEMETRADAFIALPGGMGTLYEVAEILVLKQLGYHQKPLVLLSVNGFYDTLEAVLDAYITQSFASAECRGLYHVAKDVPDAMAYLETYRPFETKRKWLTDLEG